jgi:hypothetical protein
MNIERLNKAASAAGFAMATPDDDAAVVEAPADEVSSEARALVPAKLAGHRLTGDALTALSTWAKGVWPTWGWRLPA